MSARQPAAPPELRGYTYLRLRGSGGAVLRHIGDIAADLWEDLTPW